MSQDAGLDFDFDAGQDLDSRHGGLEDAREIARQMAEEDARQRAAADREQARTDRGLATLQGTVAGVPPEEGSAQAVSGQVVPTADTVELLGKRFRLAEKVGLMPLLKFSAFSGMDTSDSRALAAMYAMLRDCIFPGTPACGNCDFCDAGQPAQCKAYDKGDWQAFEDWAVDSKAEADDLLDVITKAIEVISGRPTKQPSPSPAGRRSISGGSTASSSSRRGRGSRR